MTQLEVFKKSMSKYPEANNRIMIIFEWLQDINWHDTAKIFWDMLTGSERDKAREQIKDDDWMCLSFGFSWRLENPFFKWYKEGHLFDKLIDEAKLEARLFENIPF